MLQHAPLPARPSIQNLLVLLLRRIFIELREEGGEERAVDLHGVYVQ